MNILVYIFLIYLGSTLACKAIYELRKRYWPEKYTKKLLEFHKRTPYAPFTFDQCMNVIICIPVVNTYMILRFIVTRILSPFKQKSND